MVEYPENVIPFPIERLSVKDRLVAISRVGYPPSALELLLQSMERKIALAFCVPIISRENNG